ncbi:MAG: 4Fe-4S binding protein [Syntrophorhabdus sp.]|nr:4Fe-4S binding protein [Syntrophorhabdus sp.]
MMIPVVDKETCTGCATCWEVCPPGAILFREGKAIIDEDLCEECGFCAAECPVKAIDIPFPRKEQ